MSRLFLQTNSRLTPAARLNTHRRNLICRAKNPQFPCEKASPFAADVNYGSFVQPRVIGPGALVWSDSRMRREGAIWLWLGVWLVGVAAGFAAWERYDAAAGAVAATEPEARPAAGAWSLTMYVHPHCPCARTTVAELNVILQQSPVLVAAEIVFILPPDVPAGWECGELWDAVTALPNVGRRTDSGGEEARRAGATTSGHVILTDPAGRAAFAGGITRARGRSGDSPGRRAILALLRGETETTRAPTFGCPLSNQQPPERRDEPCPR